MKRLSPLMFAGTGSDVGKSVIAAAFCRIFKQDGYTPAPFKAQNMALNSFATPEGLEIGRAQAVQAEAAGVPCHTDMNPLLLKPVADSVAQVVLHGKAIGNQKAVEYFKADNKAKLRVEVNNAFDRLEKQYHPIVMEGAGSISEINLRNLDLVNMPMAMYAGASVILVADIDRGGVFASVYGTIMLLTEEERKHVKGILINKFRGDIRLFESGITMIEELCGIPVVGVVPYYKDIYIEEEDSVMLQTKQRESMHGKVNVAVVLLQHLSNFTDFNALERDPRVHLFYTNNPKELSKADIIILPGSKSTIHDLAVLRNEGLAKAIVTEAKNGKTILGICGGYQMMGESIEDPLGVESNMRRIPGLGLLPIATTMDGDKITRQSKFYFGESKELCEGYEIHNGRSTLTDPQAETINRFENGEAEGCRKGNCLGTYLHGILDNREFTDALIAPWLSEKEQETEFDYKAFKEEQYDKLADHVRKHVKMELVYEMMI